MKKVVRKSFLDLRITAFFLYLLSIIYEYIFDYDRDIEVYRSLLLGRNNFNLQGSYPEFLQTIGIIRVISPLFLYLCTAILSIYIFYSILLTLKRYLSIPLVLVLIGNPIAIGWFLIPSKEAFIILAITLISDKKKNYSPLINVISFISGILLTIIVRPWLILLSLFSYVFSNYENNKITSLFKNKYVLISLLVVSFLFFKYIFPNLESYAGRAAVASFALTEEGARNIFRFDVGNIYLSLFVNTLPVLFFSITNFGGNKIIYLLLNFICLLLIWRVTKFGFEYKTQTIIVFLSYVMPYSVAVVNAGNALRIILTASICSAMVVNYKHKNIYKKINQKDYFLEKINNST